MTTTITIEEFKQFHTIDRDMYRKLTFYLHHDPLLSIRVMTFWLWLESSGMHRNFVSYLHSLPSHLVNSLVLETITCLCCLDYSSSSTLPLNVVEIPCLQLIVNNHAFSLPYLVNNKTTILESMQKISNSVCARAFDDLLSQLLAQRQQYQTPGGSMFQSGSTSMDHVDVMTPIGVGPRRNNVSRGDMTREMMIRSEEKEIVNMMINTPFVVEDQIISPDHHQQPPPHLMTTTEHANSRMSTNRHEKTVFLTFSKGYPVTESQLIDFFTRRFGDIIEELIMQEVPLGEQPLYARMLVYSSNGVETVLGGQNRVKFTINGKHVYARKYVKKNPNASSSSSSHQHYYSPPPSPMAAAPE